MFVAAERLFDLPALWAEIETADMPERARIALFDEVAVAVRSQIADLLRICPPGSLPQPNVDRIKPGIEQLGRQTKSRLLDEVQAHSSGYVETQENEGEP